MVILENPFQFSEFKHLVYPQLEYTLILMVHFYRKEAPQKRMIKNRKMVKGKNNTTFYLIKN